MISSAPECRRRRAFRSGTTWRIAPGGWRGKGISVVLIGLGSNQGASVAIVEAAIKRLAVFAQPGSFLRSSLFRTSPVDCAPGVQDFINAVVAFAPRAGISPENLLADLKAMEQEFGRAATYERHAPRELDLDLLTFGDEQRSDERLTLPHPRACERLFVLAPAADIVPTYVWPGIGLSVGELVEQLETDEQVERLAPDADVLRA